MKIHIFFNKTINHKITIFDYKYKLNYIYENSFIFMFEKFHIFFKININVLK